MSYRQELHEAFEAFWMCEGGQEDGPDKEVARQAFRAGAEWEQGNQQEPE